MQPRARATRDALLAAARELLRTRDFDELSVADLASSAGLSVGSFYGRFRDKASFFDVLQEQLAQQWLAIGLESLRPGSGDGRSAARIVADVAATYVALMRADTGLVRTALRHASIRPESWSPVARVRDAFIAEAVDVLSARLPHLPAARRADRIRFAMQVLFGTGVNAVLNDTGPIRLADPRLERELARVMAAYLELDP